MSSHHICLKIYSCSRLTSHPELNTSAEVCTTEIHRILSISIQVVAGMSNSSFKVLQVNMLPVIRLDIMEFMIFFIFVLILDVFSVSEDP